MNSPKKILERWIKHFNGADIEGLLTLYADDAVNHQVALEPVTGKESIREMFTKEFATTKMVCIPVNIFEDGNWAILEWKDPRGFRGCGFFHIESGKIKLQRGYWDKQDFKRLYKSGNIK